MVVRPPLRFTTALALSAAFILSASIAAAQDEESAPPDGSAATGDSGDLYMPATVAGQPMETTIASGEMVLASMDPENPEHVQQLEDLTALLADVGATIDELSVGSAQVFDGEEYVLLIALRVEGVDLQADMAPWLEFVTAASYDEPETTDGEYGGKQVKVVVEADYPFDDPPKSFAYAAGDTIWFIGGNEEWAIEALEALPA